MYVKPHRWAPTALLDCVSLCISHDVQRVTPQPFMHTSQVGWAQGLHNLVPGQIKMMYTRKACSHHAADLWLSNSKVTFDPSCVSRCNTVTVFYFLSFCLSVFSFFFLLFFFFLFLYLLLYLYLFLSLSVIMTPKLRGISCEIHLGSYHLGPTSAATRHRSHEFEDSQFQEKFHLQIIPGDEAL